MVDSLGRILDGYEGAAGLLLENTAGQGHTIGVTFEEIASILLRVGCDDVGVCVDTAHVFASGYDVRTARGVDDLVEVIEDTVALERVKLVHGKRLQGPF